MPTQRLGWSNDQGLYQATVQGWRHKEYLEAQGIKQPSEKSLEADITNHKHHIQRLLQWVDLIPEYQNDPLTVQEQNRMYLATFPKTWTQQFDITKNIDETSYGKINHFMEKQKELADVENQGLPFHIYL